MSKVVLITGASSGIGLSIANFLLEKGFTVYGTSRSATKVASYAFHLVELDVLKVATIEKAVAHVIEKEGKLDVLVNNAGMGITGPIEDTPTDEMRKVFNTNLFGAVDVMKAVLPQMRKQQAGTIINVTSIAGYMGLPYRGIYSASKGALELLTEAYRIEIKDFNIQMCNLAPGDFATNIASGRFHAPVLKDSAYKKPYETVLKAIDEDVNKGSDPIAVAKKVLEIIMLKKPKIHYKVGAFMQKFSVILRFVLPDRMYEKMMINHYKL